MNFKRGYQFGSDWDKQYGSDKNVSIWSLREPIIMNQTTD